MRSPCPGHVLAMSLPCVSHACHGSGRFVAMSLTCLCLSLLCFAMLCRVWALCLLCPCHVFPGVFPVRCLCHVTAMSLRQISSPTLRASYVSHACARAWTPPVECADPSSPLYKVPVPPESPCTRCQRGLRWRQSRDSAPHMCSPRSLSRAYAASALPCASSKTWKCISSSCASAVLKRDSPCARICVRTARFAIMSSQWAWNEFRAIPT